MPSMAFVFQILTSAAVLLRSRTRGDSPPALPLLLPLLLPLFLTPLSHCSLRRGRRALGQLLAARILRYGKLSWFDLRWDKGSIDEVLHLDCLGENPGLQRHVANLS